MVATNRHFRSLEYLTNNELLDISNLLIKTKKILKKVLKPDGFNIGLNIGKASGAGIEKHIHIHIVPRWVGDTNFMPTIGQTKIISQSLTDLYKKIKAELK